MKNKTLAILCGLVLASAASQSANACDRCGCKPTAASQKSVAYQKGRVTQKSHVAQKGCTAQKGCSRQKGCGCGKDCNSVWAGYCSKGCGQKSCGRKSCLGRSKGCGCQQRCSKGGKCSTECDSCGGSGCGGGRGCGLLGGKSGGGGCKMCGGCCGPMPQTCYSPRYGCYSGNNRHMHRYPAFHAYYYRRPYNYRNLFDYPWHADLHEPTSLFSYNVPAEEEAADDGPGFDNGNASSPERLEDIVPPLPEEEARRTSDRERRQAALRRATTNLIQFRR